MHQSMFSAHSARSQAEFQRTALARGRNFCALRSRKGGIAAHCARPRAVLRPARAQGRNFCALRSPKGAISAPCARPRAEFLRTALAQGRNFCALRSPKGGISAYVPRHLRFTAHSACPSAFQVDVLSESHVRPPYLVRRSTPSDALNAKYFKSHVSGSSYLGVQGLRP